MKLVQKTLGKIVENCVLSICENIYKRKMEHADAYLRNHRTML